MNCQESEQSLALELYGELGEDERAALAAHLAGCEACAVLQRKGITADNVISVAFTRPPINQP